MARGKHARAKASRDLKALQERAFQLNTDLASERAKRIDAEVRAEVVQRRRAELATQLERNQDQLATYTQRLRDELAHEEALTDRVAKHLAAVRETWTRIGARVIDSYGGDVGGTERFMRAVGVAGVLTAEVAGSLDTDAVRRIQIARGRRPSEDVSHDPDRAKTLGDSIAGMLRPGLDAVDDLPPDHPARQELRQRRDRVAAAGPHVMTADAVNSWYPLIYLGWDKTNPFEGVPAHLGVTTAANSGAPQAVHQIAHTRLRAGELWPLASRDAGVATAAGRLQAPWQPMPRFSRPGDAALLRHQYASAAHGAWLRAAEADGPEPGDPLDESLWSHPEPTAVIGQLARTAVAARTAVPFWLPPGQTHGFADSEPIQEADLGDVRMPFDSCLLTFAEPLRLEATGRDVDVDPPPRDVVKALRFALTELHRGRASEGTAAPSFWNVLARLGDDLGTYTDSPITPAQLLADFGGWVEGVLFLAGEEGHLSDEFAWCIALDAQVEGAVAGRVLVPARRSACSPQVRALVLNLAAVPAWGDWHQPEQMDLPAPLPAKAAAELGNDPAFLAAERRGTPGQVRVLNISRTAGGEPSAALGRSVSPHLRRGHWRRQHYGPGRLMTRRVRISAVLVNAGKFIDVAPRVYTIPAAPPGPTQP